MGVVNTGGCGLFGRTGSNLLPTALHDHGHASAQGPRLDGKELDGSVDFYCKQALAVSTKSYTSAQKRYIQFCITHSITAVPTTEQLLCFMTLSCQ